MGGGVIRLKGLILKGEFELLELKDIYETISAFYEIAEQAEEMRKTISSGLVELEEKIAELRENAEALMDDLGPEVANPE